MTSSKPLTDYEQGIVDNVQQYGCHITFVFDEKGEDPDFSYSIGFRKTVNQAEVIIFGLDRDLMHSMINNLLEQCQGGLELKEGAIISGLLEGHQCVARKVHASQIDEGYFNSSMWFHEREFGAELTEAMQIVWPDAYDGKFPWDHDSSEDVRVAQPALYEPRLAA